MDLTEFLRARLDEDEAQAKAWAEPGGTHWPWLEKRWAREVEAKRAILADIEEATCISGHAALWLLSQKNLCSLAAVYSDHPDYRAEWKP